MEIRESLTWTERSSCMNRVMRISYVVVLVLIVAFSVFGMAMAAAAEALP
jgi:hypothetical protein